MKKSNIFLIFVLVSFICFVQTLYAQDEQMELGAGQIPEAQPEAHAQPGKISLDIKGMDVIDVLKILAMRGNLNIVAGKNVRGRVTLFLKNVEIMDALEIILAANELAYEKRGSIINVMSERDYEALYGEKSYDKRDVKIIRLKYAKALEVSKSLTQIKSKIGSLVVDEGSNTVVLIDVSQKIKEMEELIQNMDLATLTKTFSLNYAKAEDVQEKIKDSLSKYVGEIKTDERMNKVIVTDFPEKIDYLSKIITDLDERDRVVLIEAKIIQITLNKDVGYGINWKDVFAGIDTIAQADLNIDLSGVTAPTTFTYTRAHGATEYGDKIILKLLEKLGKTDVLSTPQITVANNQEAKVLVGTKEAYVTSTVTQSTGVTSTADNVQFVDVGVSLAVTPTITGDGYIIMKIKPEVSSAPTSLQLKNSDGSVRTSVPIVTTSEAETKLLVKDGTSIIMAGLMKDTRKDNTEQIPLLGNIPLLGHFFRTRAKENAKTELVIFLTPHIIKDGKGNLPEAERYLKQHEETALKGEDRQTFKETLFLQPPEEEELLPSVFPSQSPLESEIKDLPKNFEEYCAYLSDKIDQNLQKNRASEFAKQEIQLSFILTSEGLLKEKPQVLNYLDDQTKELAIKSVEQAAPFPPFPQEYRENTETFKLTVCFEENP